MGEVFPASAQRPAGFRGGSGCEPGACPHCSPPAVLLSTTSPGCHQAQQKTALCQNASYLTKCLVSLSPSVLSINNAPSLSNRLAVGT